MTVHKGVPLAGYTTFGVGGRAEYFAEAVCESDIAEAAGLSRHITVLGGGSNMLVSDCGVDGLVLRIRSQGITLSGDRCIIDAGTPLARVSAFYLASGFGGMEWAAGVPGTVGGAAIMNAGAYGRCIADCTDWVEVLREGRTVRLLNADCAFVYRGSGFYPSDIITRAALRYSLCEKEKIKELREEFRVRRAESQPKGKSAGSVFKRVESTALAAAYYIDRAGLKGFKVGGAVVSEKHANFILNTGSATASDIAALIRMVKEKVYETFGIMLEEEIKYVGKF